MKHVTAALVANGYPKRFVIDVGKPKRLAQQLSTTAPDAAKGFCILPYIKGTSEPIKRILSNHNIKVHKKRVFGEFFFHFPLKKVEGSTETFGLKKHCTYFYTILTRVTFLFS